MESKVDRAMQTAGDILVGGYGDKFIVGVIRRLLTKARPEKLFEYLQNDTPLDGNVAEADWSKYRFLVRKSGINIDKLTADEVLAALRKTPRGVMIAGMLISHPRGRAWLEKQLVQIKDKLR